jgi:hypothetical protein
MTIVIHKSSNIGQNDLRPVIKYNLQQLALFLTSFEQPRNTAFHPFFGTSRTYATCSIRHHHSICYMLQLPNVAVSVTVPCLSKMNIPDSLCAVSSGDRLYLTANDRIGCSDNDTTINFAMSDFPS